MNRNRLFASIGIAFIACLCLFGCTRKGQTPPRTAQTSAKQIAFVTINASDYWIIVNAGVSEAAKELGPDYSVQFVMPSDGSAATQMADVNDLVAKGVKAIAISPSDPNMETPWLNNLSKSVSIITVDSDAPASKRLAYLGTDNYAAGQLAGQLIKQALPKGGKIVLFVGKKNAENAVEREQGITDCLAGSNVHILDIMEDNADIGKAKANAARAIADYPDLAMEVGLWSKNGPAILSAVNDAHRIGKIKIVCFDQDVDTLSGIKSNAIYATVVQQPYEIGYQSTKLLAHLVAGDNSGLPKTGTKYFESKAITHANVDQYMADLSKETGTYWGP